MLNCISATTRPNSGMKRPSTPASFMRRSARFGIARASQDLEEEAVGLRIVAQAVVDQASWPRDLRSASGMKVEALLVGDMENADEVDRILGEDSLVDGVDAAILDEEIRRFGTCARRFKPKRRQERAERSARLAVLLPPARRAEDARQVADILGDEEVVLHEALDGAKPGMTRV